MKIDDGFRPKRWTYGWDAHDRMVSCVTSNSAGDSDTWLYRYDPFGRRVSKVGRFSEAERARAHLKWPRLVGSEGAGGKIAVSDHRMGISLVLGTLPDPPNTPKR